MFRNWSKVFTTDCCVIQLEDNSTVYPIFKNGKSSLFVHAEKKKLNILKNKQIENIEKIKIFLRDPLRRFVSGVHTVIELEKINNVDVFLKEVESLRTYDRHFFPQFYWLMHLFKYFNGVIELSPVADLYELIPNRNKPPIKKLTRLRKEKILTINNKIYVDVDYKLINKYLGQTVELEKIIREFKNEVS